MIWFNEIFLFGENVRIGFGEPVAYEGALKIKEMCYLHAEGYSGGALKHGPFALIEDETGKFGSTPIILLILDDEHAHHMRTAAEEVCFCLINISFHMNWYLTNKSNFYFINQSGEG